MADSSGIRWILLIKPLVILEYAIAIVLIVAIPIIYLSTNNLFLSFLPFILIWILAYSPLIDLEFLAKRYSLKSIQCNDFSDINNSPYKNAIREFNYQDIKEIAIIAELPIFKIIIKDNSGARWTACISGDKFDNGYHESKTTAELLRKTINQYSDKIID